MLKNKKSCFTCKHYGELCPVDKIGHGVPCIKWEVNDGVDRKVQDNRRISES